ncbi:DUF420 domain-containing protein [Magnetospirillum sp. UT-4]|uniref:DUF420 domain-containing protein n=1 Tax=Magnetospirillum sp. UT-4 TaxID=2681467 RepID=UPI00137E762A|nr:DUF420 domain-containing protein [Magnetospirillum sp. UT-4]CAA7618683.1 Predicted membrane protein [Magnetospirillum sp. UT-4]
MTAQDLPHLTAGLNALTLVLLLAGLAAIRAGRRGRHRGFMLAAAAASAAFLVVYVVYHLSAPIFQFRGEGMLRPFYYTLLVSHVVLAALVAPLAAVTLWRGWSGQTKRHRRIARWTLPLWLYVGVSGLAVYAMLYHLVP